ncbi:MAG: hypothetical protein ACE5R6_11830 [Candidatus Heimdallarchaeota archaeon]
MIYGAIHIKADFLGPSMTWATRGGVLTAFSFLVYQIYSGALWGVAYVKNKKTHPPFCRPPPPQLFGEQAGNHSTLTWKVEIEAQNIYGKNIPLYNDGKPIVNP